MNVEATALLIHGVGNPRPDSIARLVSRATQNLGYPDVEIHEIDWNKIVDHPVSMGHVSPDRSSKLLGSLLAAPYFCTPRFIRCSPIAFRHVFHYCVFLIRVLVASSFLMTIFFPAVCLILEFYSVGFTYVRIMEIAFAIDVAVSFVLFVSSILGAGLAGLKAAAAAHFLAHLQPFVWALSAP